MTRSRERRPAPSPSGGTPLRGRRLHPSGGGHPAAALPTLAHMRRVLLLVAVLGLVAGSAHAAPAGAAGTRAVSLEQELLQELNEARGERGLRPLRLANGLQTAAVGHSRSMLAGRFLAHESRDGTQMAERVRRLYPPLGGSWSVGENP